ncbi:MAG: hypothetical protein ACI38A_08190 [Candidatus Ornithomonoglobus sp.]
MQFDLYSARGCEQKAVSSFYGLNRNRRASAGEFEDMKNMSTLEYPCAAPRGARTVAAEARGKVYAAAAPDSTDTDAVTGFTGISDGAFFYNGAVKSGSYVLSENRKWEIVRLGNLYIMNGYNADGAASDSELYYYNIDTGAFGKGFTEMSDLIVTSGKDDTGNYLHTFRYGFSEVYDYSVTDTGGREIKNSVFFDTYGNGIRLLASNIFEKYFSVGDEITIEGFPTAEQSVGQVWMYSGSAVEVVPQNGIAYDENNTVDTDVIANLDEVYNEQVVNAVVSGFKVDTVSLSGMTLYVHYIYFDLTNKNGDSVDFADMNAHSHYCSGVRLSKKRRTFDHISVHQNRLWGTAPSGNALYASASDDIFSFSSSDILSNYAARLPSDTPGAFTGIYEYGTELAAFKEDSITVIYGTNASNYASYIIEGTGCMSGSTAAVTPSGIIFPSWRGFYRFSGGTPVCISYKLNTRYISAVSGFDGEKYYACAVRKDGVRELLTYDMRYGCWHVQDDIDVSGFFRFRGGFYIVSGSSVYLCDDSEGTEESDWYFTSAKYNDSSLDNKALNEIWIRADVAEGASFTVETCADDGGFIAHETFREPGLRIFRCSIRAAMGNSWRYRISGKGKVVFYDIELRKAPGGRRYMRYENSDAAVIAHEGVRA